jgi:hypothetical protein
MAFDPGIIFLRMIFSENRFPLFGIMRHCFYLEAAAWPAASVGVMSVAPSARRQDAPPHFFVTIL